MAKKKHKSKLKSAVPDLPMFEESGEELDTEVLAGLFNGLESEEESEEEWVDPEIEAVFSDEEEKVVLPEGVDPEEYEGLHPAEIAAKYAADHDEKNRESIGGGDDQILKDLRKLVFNVPLMPQADVHKLFLDMDARLVPLIYEIANESNYFMEEMYQVVVKVGAGNTYGKNIYERADSSAESTAAKVKTTYKAHEIDFLKQAHHLLQTYTFPKRKIEETTAALNRCQFIRGVFEEILESFITKLADYHHIHWKAAKAKIKGDATTYVRLSERLRFLDQKYQLGPKVYGLSVQAAEVYEYYRHCRSRIISPYLRSVYSAARSTARNSHQMLDNFQNGSIGLIRAVSCYSTNRLASFASVAKWWIKQMMLLSIKEDANFVKLPVSTWQAYTQLEKAKSKLGILDEDVEAIAKSAKISPKKAKAVYQAVKLAQVYSLNRTYDNNDKLSLEDIVTNEDRIGSDHDGFSDLLRDYCIEAGLTDEEKLILALRHGMPDILDSDSDKLRQMALMEALVQNLALIGYDYKIDYVSTGQ